MIGNDSVVCVLVGKIETIPEYKCKHGEETMRGSEVGNGQQAKTAMVAHQSNRKLACWRPGDLGMDEG